MFYHNPTLDSQYIGYELPETVFRLSGISKLSWLDSDHMCLFCVNQLLKIDLLLLVWQIMNAQKQQSPNLGNNLIKWLISMRKRLYGSDLP